jgi:hypothetical protein
MFECQFVMNILLTIILSILFIKIDLPDFSEWTQYLRFNVY